MKRSTDRILTTHVGSLAHTQEMHDLLAAKEGGQPVDQAALDALARRDVSDSVRMQVEVGLTVINDGEQGKSSWSSYVKDRVNGFDGQYVPRPTNRDQQAFPEFYQYKGPASGGVGAGVRAACSGPVSWKDFASVEKDIANFKAALDGLDYEEAFMTASSPGNISNFYPNQYYSNEDEYLAAVCDLMKREYEAIVDAGFILQFDCPDLALSSYFPDMSVEEFKKVVEQRVEALDYASRDIDPERMRLHVCWGRGEGPKYHDVPLRDIAPILMKARPNALSIVGANGRHEWEWQVWQEIRPRDGMMLIPGVIDNTTNIVEHPETVAERLVRYAGILGRENVMGGVDCGFGNAPHGGDVVPTIAWEKLRSLSEGARIASERLWK